MRDARFRRRGEAVKVSLLLDGAVVAGEATERAEEARAKFALSPDRDVGFAEDDLAKLARLSGTPSAVRDREIVEHQQLTLLQMNFKLHVVDAQRVALEEPKLGLVGVELRAA